MFKNVASLGAGWIDQDHSIDRSNPFRTLKSKPRMWITAVGRFSNIFSEKEVFLHGTSSSLGQATHSSPSNQRIFKKKATGLTWHFPDTSTHQKKWCTTEVLFHGVCTSHAPFKIHVLSAITPVDLISVAMRWNTIPTKERHSLSKTFWRRGSWSFEILRLSIASVLTLKTGVRANTR